MLLTIRLQNPYINFREKKEIFNVIQNISLTDLSYLGLIKNFEITRFHCGYSLLISQNFIAYIFAK